MKKNICTSRHTFAYEYVYTNRRGERGCRSSSAQRVNTIWPTRETVTKLAIRVLFAPAVTREGHMSCNRIVCLLQIVQDARTRLS